MSASTFGDSGVVLLFHRVAAVDHDPDGLAVPPAVFSQQMAYLRETCRPLPLPDLIDTVRQGRAPARAVALTFDDGYLDALTTASPMLLDYGLPATFFVTTASLDSPQEYWWDTLARSGLTGTDRDRLHARLLHGSVADRAVLGGHRLAEGPPAARPMLAPEITELASRAGHGVGAHTVHHLFLPSQPAVVVTDELESSKLTLEALLGRAVTAVAYPYGGVDGAVRRATRVAGYTTALDVTPAAMTLASDPFCLPRLLAPTTMAEFVDQLEGLLSGELTRT